MVWHTLHVVSSIVQELKNHLEERNGYLDVKLTHYVQLNLIILLTNKPQSYISESNPQTRFNKWVWNLVLNVVLHNKTNWPVRWLCVRKLVKAKLHPLQRLLYHWLILIWTTYILISTLLIRNSCWTSNHTRYILIPELNVALKGSISLLLCLFIHSIIIHPFI